MMSIAKRIRKLPLKLNKPDNYPIIYHLKLGNKDKARRIEKHFCNDAQCNGFSKPVTLSKTPKLYVVRSMNKKVLYVGYADQSITNRMRYGLYPKYQKGYNGYGWMMQAEVELLIWVFEPFKTGLKKGDKEYDTYKRSIECIEAEIVFYIREETKEWPQFQREIHFGNENREEVMKSVQDIIQDLKQNSNVVPMLYH